MPWQSMSPSRLLLDFITYPGVNMPNSKRPYTKTMFLTDSHKAIRPLVDEDLNYTEICMSH
ncbi:MAG: hypothetical protein IJP44_07260 [Bacteroidales bacterium]|nr:hypothetical protein [Bacteroidales bacterium]